MSSSKLVAYLVEASGYEQRIEIAREILAHNMNFSPAWLLAILRERTPQTAQNTQQNKFLKVTQFRRLFQLIGFKLQDSEVIALFEYFDKDQKNKVNNEHFIQYMLPTLKESLKKAALKRSTSDIELTLDLKHALKRIFKQILIARNNLKLFEGQFGHQSFKLKDDLSVTKQQIKNFLQTFGKYPSQSEVILITNTITQGKLKQITQSQICNLIESSKKQVQILAHNPSLLQSKTQNQLIKIKAKQLEGSIQVEKILKKGLVQNSYIKYIGRQQNLHYPLQSLKNKIEPVQILEKQNKSNEQLSPKSLKGKQMTDSPLFKIQRTNSIINNETVSEPLKQLKRATQIADQLLQKRQQNSQEGSASTPFKKVEFTQNPTIFYPSRRRSNGSDLTELIDRNQELEDQIQAHKKENGNRIREAKLNLGYI